MKKHNYVIYSLIFALLLTTVSPILASAKESTDKEEALSESILYNLNTKKLELDKVIAKEEFDFSNEELNHYSDSFQSLTQEETHELLLDSGLD